MPYTPRFFGVLVILALISCGGSDTPTGGSGDPEGFSVALEATPTRGPVPLRVRFESGARSAAGLELTYTWQLANRTFTGGANRSHTFTRAGSFEVRVSVSDGVTTQDDSVTVEVGAVTGGEPGNRSPTVTLNASPTSGTEDLSVAFSATASDPDGDDLSYSWDFGDGSEAESGSAARHTYEQEGTYTATLTVTDGRGGYGSDAVEIEVADNRGGGGDDDGGDDDGDDNPNPLTSPDIDDFDVSEDSIAAGETVTLSWSLVGGEPATLELTNDVGGDTVDLLGETSFTVTPEQTTTYTLTATNAQGRDLEQETVKVDGDGGDDDGGDDNGGEDNNGGGDDDD